MSIVSSETIIRSVQADGQRIVHKFTDHLGGITPFGPKLVDSAWTETEFTADRAALESYILDQLADKEIMDAVKKAELGLNPDKVSDHQTQAEFDRRVLGNIMTILDAHTVYAAYPFFQAVESRGGANAGQRATYLGIDSGTYSLIATRFNDVSGIAFFLNDAKSQVWDGLPEGYY